MDQLLIEAAKQVPALVVLAYLTVQFLNHMKSRDEAFTTELKAIHEAGKDSREANARVIEKNTELTGRVLATLERLDSREDRLEAMVRDIKQELAVIRAAQVMTESGENHKTLGEDEGEQF